MLVSTLAQSLHISGAKLLELDSRELGTLVIPAGDKGRGLGAVLYDNVPGGAGHVRELLSLEREWLDTARATLFVDEQHHISCETACLDCLLTFDAQEVMRRGLLNRRLAIKVLDALLQGTELPSLETDSDRSQILFSIVDKMTVSMAASKKNNEERIQEAQQRAMKHRKRS